MTNGLQSPFLSGQFTASIVLFGVALLSTGYAFAQDAPYRPVVILAEHAPAADNAEIRWSGRCHDDPFSVAWRWPADEVQVDRNGVIASYGPSDAFVTALFLADAPTTLFTTCAPGTEDLRVEVLSVRRSDDRVQIVRGNVVFGSRGQLLSYDGPFQETLDALPRAGSE